MRLRVRPAEHRHGITRFEEVLAAAGPKVLGSNELLDSFAWFAAVKP